MAASPWSAGAARPPKLNSWMQKDGSYDGAGYDIASFFSAVLSQNLDPDILVMQPAQN
jgi:hypothetical protein